ncbi:MAG TPA: hypothetical protein VF868_16970 [Bacteroidia bacterium]|jgi:hypothetical protein
MRDLDQTFLRLLIVSEHLGSQHYYEKYEGLHFFHNDGVNLIKSTWIMRDTDNTFMRMMILAAHLENGQFYEEYYSLHFFYSDDKKTLLIGRAGKYHCVFPQVICELPHLFLEFRKGGDGRIIYKPSPKLNSHYGMLEFFGLELDEFLHLFTVGGQKPEKYGGQLLTIDYTIDQLKSNLFEFMQIILNDRQEKNV